MSKKYKIIQSFDYRGKDGKSKTGVRLGPGEGCPELDPNERTRLLMEERISEVSADGELVRYKKLMDLTDDQIDNLLRRSKAMVMNEIKNGSYSKETLSRIFSKVDKLKLGEPILELIELKMGGEL